MQKLADFIQRRKLKFVKAAPLFGISQSHLGNIVKGRRKQVMTEAEAWFFSQIIDLVETGRHHELKPELRPADLVAIREELGMSIADTARACGLDPSHWGHLERGDDPVTQRTGYQIQLKLMERRGELPAQVAAAESPAEQPPTADPFDIQAGASSPAPQPAPCAPASLPALPVATGLALDVTKGAVWAALLALLERFGGGLAEVQRINAELLARVEQLERDGGALVDARLQAEEQARAEMARRRAYIKECVGILVDRLPGSHDVWYGRLWKNVHQAAGVSKLDEIQATEQADRAIAWLQKEAKIYSVILPAYQPMLPGVAV